MSIINVYSLYNYRENHIIEAKKAHGRATRGTDRFTSSNGEWSGNVYDFIYKVTPKLCSDLKVPFVLQGLNRVDDTPLHKLIKEAVTNCCAHADFYGRRGLVIQKGKNTFTFSNPGCLRVSKNEAIDGGISDPRNDTILKMLSMINYGERAGSDMNGIFMVWEKVYDVRPSFEEQIGVDRMILTLDTKGNDPNMDALIALYGMGASDVTEEKQAINDEKQAINDEKQAINDEKQAINDEKQAINDEKQAINDEKQAIKARDKIIALKGISSKTRDNLIKIIDYIELHPSVRNAEISGLLSLSSDRSRLLLNTLVNEGVLISAGKNKDRIYSLA